MAAAAAERGGATALPQQECLCSACLWLPGVVLAVAHACAPKQALGLVRAGQAVLVSPCGVAPPCWRRCRGPREVAAGRGFAGDCICHSGCLVKQVSVQFGWIWLWPTKSWILASVWPPTWEDVWSGRQCCKNKISTDQLKSFNLAS